jgi:hypothetical protein
MTPSYVKRNIQDYFVLSRRSISSK